jgi:hypothetical protein
MAALISEAKAVAGDCVAVGRFALERLAARLDAATAALEDATAFILAAGDKRDALAGASPYLKLAGDVVGAVLLARGVLSATAAGDDPQHATAQEALVGFYAETVLTAAPGLAASVKIGADALYDPNLPEFAS